MGRKATLHPPIGQCKMTDSSDWDDLVPDEPNYFPFLGVYPVLVGTPGNGSGTGSTLRSTDEDDDFTTSATFGIYYIDTTDKAILVTLNPNPVKDETVELWDKTGFATDHSISLLGNGNNIAGQASVPNFIQANYGHAKLQYDGVQWLMH